MRKFALIAASLAALFLTAPPAQAGGKASWTDKEGDAGSFLNTTASPLPSEPALDIVKADLASDGATFHFVMKVKALGTGHPSASPGSMYRFGFNHGEVGWNFRISEHQGVASEVAFRSTDTDNVTNLSCDKCSGGLDRKTHTVWVKAPVASVNKAMKEWVADIEPIKPGAKLGGLSVTAQRYYVRVTPTADDAVAPEGTELTV